jgi:ABC-type antimicrobial peptide transport system permease subunit
MRRQGLEREPVPQMFEPLAQNPPRSVDLFIRSSTDDPAALATPLRAAVRRVEKQTSVYGVAPLEQQFGSYLTQRRFQTSLLTGFSLVALLMAAVGIYGLIHYSVATRAPEIAIRMAVGAQTGDVVRMIVREGLQLTVTGLTIGLIGVLLAGRGGSSLLFGVSASDPMTLTAVSLLLTAVAAAACYFPARRAMRVQPIAALRQV